MNLRDAAALLREAGVPSPDHDAAELLAHVTGTARTRLGEPNPQQEQEFDALIRRRATREPLQHLTGQAHFRYATLEVGPGVFVPRPETEVMTGWVVDRLAEREHPVVVDLCTGSGAIAYALATEVPAAGVYAVELGEEAVEYARRNLAGTGVDLRHGDLSDAFPELDGAVDVVVSNPPYIPLEAFESVAPEARDHDPALALWSGEDGLDAIRQVEQAAARLLKPGGLVAVEHADVQGESAPAVFLAAGRWSGVRDHADLAGRARFVTARLAR
ncbi:MAG: peptide chain release factor N(5)-glutamine methyltransferase [Nocardioidaceae bacterium]